LESELTETKPESNLESSALISEMQARIRLLEGELEAWREESRRKDAIIMNMTEAMKALTPPAHETPADRAEPRPATEGPQEATERPWWRRVFGL
jgi:hypothetical protein